ncbi:MAG: alkaline phosphatase family protein, partial [Thermoanaerobaculia bacterium]
MSRVLRAALALLLSSCAGLASPKTPPRIVVLAFDGVDAHIVEEMMSRGRLGNLAALGNRGGYSPLTPTVPAQTPVSWSTFSTGLDPGGHEIFDFLKRNPSDRIPTFAVAEETEQPFLLGEKNAVVGLACVFALGSI